MGLRIRTVRRPKDPSARQTACSGLPHWTQPVIRDGVLYIRHGEALMAYNVKS